VSARGAPAGPPGAVGVPSPAGGAAGGPPRRRAGAGDRLSTDRRPRLPNCGAVRTGECSWSCREGEERLASARWVQEVELGSGGGYGVSAWKNPGRRWSVALFLAGQGLDDVADEEGVTLRRGATSWPACAPAGSCASAHGRVAVLGRHAGRPGLLSAAYGPVRW
jgi:hypothetical protein